MYAKGSPSMKMEEIELRKKYRYIWEDDLPYFATVERKQGGRVLITLGDRINKDGDRISYSIILLYGQ
jgi:hypothetical protein